MRDKTTSSKRIIFWLLLVAFLWIAVGHIAKTEQILRVLASGTWYWTALAVLSQLLLYPFYAYYAGYVLMLFRVNLGFRNVLCIYLASKFTDVAVPISTVGEAMIFVRSGRKLNFSSFDTGAGASLVLFLELAAFTVLSVLTLVFLSLSHQFASYLFIPVVVLAACVLFVIAWLLTAVVARRDIRPPLLKIMVWISHSLGFKQASREDVERALREVRDELAAARTKIWKALGLAFVVHLIDLSTLVLVFLAFASRFDLLAVLTAYVGGVLFTIVSITPQGVGVAETAMIAAMRAYGVDLSAAAVITLAFRGLLYWLPMFPGFYAFSRLELGQDDRRS